MHFNNKILYFNLRPLFQLFFKIEAMRRSLPSSLNFGYGGSQSDSQRSHGKEFHLDAQSGSKRWGRYGSATFIIFLIGKVLHFFD